MKKKSFKSPDYIYDFEAVAKKGIESAHNLELPNDILKAIEEESNKIQVPHVEIRGIVEISLKKPDAIDIIKNILVQVETSKSNATINVTYVGAPRYRVVVTAENFKVAEKAMNSILERIQSAVSKHHGSFNYIRQESKKTHHQG